jgi:26S proteasome regulatory subunit T1
MTKKDDQSIDTTKAAKGPEDKDKKDKSKEEKAGAELSASDIKLLKRYGKGPYTDSLKKAEDEIKNLNQKITTLCGIKESDTGLALPASWNLPADQMMLK